MNTIFLCQSNRIDLFHNCSQKIFEKNKKSKFGFFVTDSRIYNDYKKNNKLNESYILKEWEIIKEAKSVNIDYDYISKYEKSLGDPFLWNSILSDRRIYLGKKYSFLQDYKSRFNHDEILAILQVSLFRLEELFKKTKPKCIVTFQCVTLCEYLSYLFALKKNIIFLNLRPTRIENYIYASEGINEPSLDLKNTYEKIIVSKEKFHEKTEKYFLTTKQKNAMYEGVIPPSSKSPFSLNHGKKIKRNIFSPIKIKKLLYDELSYRFGELKYDIQVSGPFESIINQFLLRPLRNRKINKYLKSKYVKNQDLKNINYAFFPLHTEPEVTLLVYSKPYMNQIEAIRLISHNLPIGMKLIVKEHPWNIGKRKIGYFKKLLQIPNVLIASPELSSRDLINHSKIVAVISGSIAFESII